MPRRAKFQIALALCGPLCLSQAAAQSRDQVSARLEGIAEAAARIQRTVCDADLDGMLRGAAASINAMPQRSGAAPLVLGGRASLGDFADAFAALLEEDGADADALEHAAILGMLHAADPAGHIFRGPQLTGGVMMMLDTSASPPTIVDLYPGGPAARAGLAPGDRLLSLNGRAAATMSNDEIVRSLRGAVGSSLSVVAERQGATMEVTLVLEEMSAAATSNLRWRVAGRVGVISLWTFDEGSAAAIGDAVREIRRTLGEPAGYVLDLRHNSGGLLDQVFDAADQFIDGGGIAFTRAHRACDREVVQRYNARRGDETGGAPLVVLIGPDTARGAEFVAITLRERRSAVLIGQTTQGNSRLHTVIPMFNPRYRYLMITTSLLTTFSGASWDGQGVSPDIVVPVGGDGDPVLALALSRLGE